MTFPIAGIPGVSALAGMGGVAGVDTTASASQAVGTGGDAFSSILASSFDQLQATQANADGLAAQAATGELRDVTDYLIASNEAKLTAEMVVTIKNKAVEAFNEIMRMPV